MNESLTGTGLRLCTASTGGTHDWNFKGRCRACGIRAGTIVNLTPHPVDVYGEDGALMTSFPASGTVARITQHEGEWRSPYEVPLPGGGYGRFPLVPMSYGEITGLPGMVLVHHLGFDNGDAISVQHLYIVSMPVALHPSVAGREDILYPGDPVRDATGRMIGVTSLYHLLSTDEQRKAARDTARWAP
jgi:hypothetical protein